MKTTFPLVLVSLAGLAHPGNYQSTVAAKDQRLFETILAKEKEILETVKRNDIKAFADLLSDDVLAIDDEGFHAKADFVKDMETQKQNGLLFTDYQMEDIRFIRLGPDAAILAYKETLRGVEAGKPFLWHIYGHSVYQRRKGRWVFRLFQDTMAKE